MCKFSSKSGGVPFQISFFLGDLTRNDPPYFNMLKPNMPLVCDYYGLCKPKIHLPTIRHDFAKQLVQYCLSKLFE